MKSRKSSLSHPRFTLCITISPLMPSQETWPDNEIRDFMEKILQEASNQTKEAHLLEYQVQDQEQFRAIFDSKEFFALYNPNRFRPGNFVLDVAQVDPKRRFQVYRYSLSDGLSHTVLFRFHLATSSPLILFLPFPFILSLLSSVPFALFPSS